jgi:hypothetical protein
MARGKAAVAVEDDDDDTVELEELDEEVEEAPAKATKKKAVDDDIWSVRNLIDLIAEKTGKIYSPREVRTLLRKMARGGEGIDREIVAGNKSRYAWTGPNDPEVRAVLKQVRGGAIEASKKAALDKLKADKAAKNAAIAKQKAAADAKAAKATKSTKKSTKAVAPPPDDDDDDDTDDEDDE